VVAAAVAPVEVRYHRLVGEEVREAAAPYCRTLRS